MLVLTIVFGFALASQSQAIQSSQDGHGLTNSHAPRSAWSWSDAPPTDWFTVYMREDFARAPLVEAYAIFKAHKNESAKLAGLLKKTSLRSYNDHCFHNDDTHPFVQNITIATGWVRNYMGDQYIEVTFNDGAVVRYTQPRWGKVVRDRADVWVRAATGLVSANGIYLKSEPLSHYPEQLLIIRPRVSGDPKFDTSYSRRARVMKKASVVGAAVGGVAVGLYLGVTTVGVAAIAPVTYGVLAPFMNAALMAAWTMGGATAGGVGGGIGGNAITGGYSTGEIESSDK